LRVAVSLTTPAELRSVDETECSLPQHAERRRGAGPIGDLLPAVLTRLNVKDTVVSTTSSEVIPLPRGRPEEARCMISPSKTLY